MKKILLTGLLLSWMTGFSFAQQTAYFKPVAEADIRLEKGLLRDALPGQYKTYQLDYAAVRAVLQTAPLEFTAAARQHNCVISIPLADGSCEPFAVWQTAMMEPELAARFPYIRTFAGQSLQTPGLTVRLSYTARGFRAMVMQPDFGVVYVEPYSWNQDTYYIVYKQDDALPDATYKLERRWIPGQGDPVTDQGGDQPFVPEPSVQDRDLLLDPVKLKVYRYVVATTGEFSQDHGGTKPLVFSAVVEYTNMVSAVFERDIALRLQLIAASENVVFLNPNTDPYDGEEVGNWMEQNPGVVNFFTNVNSHDVGHVYARYISGGAIGVAGGITCGDGKARGCSAGTGTNDYGPGFLGVIGQEVGHQMSGGHTWNRCAGGGGRAGLTAFEPGGGSTIMSYAGACGPDNIQNNADLYYHSGSIEEIRNFYTFNAGTACGSFTQTDNNAPVVTLPYQDNFFIPISTPFELDGSATDLDNDPLVFNWEEIDAGPETPLGMPTGNAAIFRTWPAVPATNRYFPRLPVILTNGFSAAEQLPTYSRDLTFRLVARDNRLNGGGVGWADVAFKAWEDAGPFLVISPNLTSTIWRVGEYVNVTWDVANTEVAPVNCKHVNIRLSTDGGQSYPIMLAENVVNDGGQYVLVPNNLSSTARVRVDAADNVFFDISNQNFKIQDPVQPSFTFGLSTDVQNICLPDNFTTEILSAGVLGFNSAVTLDISGSLPPGATASFSATTINPGEPSTLSLDLSGVNQEGTFTFEVRAIVIGTGDTLLRPVTLSFVRNDFSALQLQLPGDGSTNLGLTQTVAWNKAEDAETYDVQVSKSPSFDVILSSKTNVSVDTFKIPLLLEKGTAYYWRVRPRNECGLHDWTEANFFSTYAENCLQFAANDLPKNLSANGTPTIESKLTVNAGGTISDITVKQIDGYHEFFGDLTARLISPAGTEVILFDDKCGNTNGSFDFALNDAAPNVFSCPPPNNGGSMKPQNPLAPFIGENSTGTWTLRIKDNVLGSGGGLQNFQLEFCASVSLEPPFLVNNNLLQLTPGTNQAVSADLLLVEDPNNTHTELIFTLVSVPQYGRLEKNFGGELHPGDQFTQTDLDNGAIRFFDYGYEEGPDGFRFVVTDGEGGFLGTPKFNINTIIVGTGEADSQAQFNLFPNPAEDAFWVSFDQALSSETRISLFDAAGRMLRNTVLAAGVDRRQIAVGDLPKGIYAVRVESAGSVGVKKLVLN